jgi:hypothetical protein
MLRPLLEHEPEADFIFQTPDKWHERERHIVQGPRQHCGNDVTARHPRKKNCTDRLQPKQRREPKEKADGNAARDGFWGIANGEQLQRVLAQPTMHVHGITFCATFY